MYKHPSSIKFYTWQAERIERQNYCFKNIEGIKRKMFMSITGEEKQSYFLQHLPSSTWSQGMVDEFQQGGQRSF